MAEDDVTIDPASANEVGGIIGQVASQSFLSSVSDDLPPVVAQVVQSIFGTFSKEGLAGLEKGAQGAAEILEKAGVGLGAALRDQTYKMFSGAEDAARKIFKALTGQELSIEALAKFDNETLLNNLEKLGEEGLGEMLIDIGMSPESIKSIKSAFGSLTGFAEPFLNQEVMIEVALGAGAAIVDKTLKGMRDQIGALEKPLLLANREATSLATPFLKFGGTAKDVRSVGDALREYRQRIVEASRQTGLSAEELTSLEKAFVANNVAAEELAATTRVSFGNLAGDIDGVAAAAVVFQGAGIDGADGAKEMSFAMRNLGLSSNEALERIGLFAEVANRTTEPITKIRQVINEGARSLKYYGDTTQGVSLVYDKFLQTVGEGREELAAEFVQTVVQGIGGMNDGLKAFLGQVSGIGGGQGAIGGMLEVEERIAAGDIQGVMDAVAEQIETISGSPLLGRQEAIATGQQDQFFLQRKLLESFGFGAGGSEATSRLLENLARGQEVMAADFNAARGIEQVAARGEERLQADLGVTGRIENFADVTKQLGLTQNVAEALQQSSGNFQEAANKLLGSVEGLQSFLGEGVEGVLTAQRQERRERLIGGVSAEATREELSGLQAPAGTAENRRVAFQKTLEEGGNTGAIGAAGARASGIFGETTEAIRPEGGPISTGAVDYDSVFKALANTQDQSTQNITLLSTQITRLLAEIKRMSDKGAEVPEVNVNVMIDPDGMNTKIKKVVQSKQQRGIGSYSRNNISP